MAQSEGVIQYRLEFRPGPAPPAPAVAELDGWRSVLHRLGLVGQQPDRYEGLGYGNVSVRQRHGFIISGTQTGAAERLGAAGYTRVTACDPTYNHIEACGPLKPSSEALTHGAIYALDPRIAAVLHVHSPELWQNNPLALPATPAGVGYGTPAMAAAVAALHVETDLPRRRLLVMGGHEDGIVAFGPSVADAGKTLVAALAAALRAR